MKMTPTKLYPMSTLTNNFMKNFYAVYTNYILWNTLNVYIGICFSRRCKELCRNKININIKPIVMSEWEIREKEIKPESLDECLS